MGTVHGVEPYVAPSSTLLREVGGAAAENRAAIEHVRVPSLLSDLWLAARAYYWLAAAVLFLASFMLAALVARNVYAAYVRDWRGDSRRIDVSRRAVARDIMNERAANKVKTH